LLRKDGRNPETEPKNTARATAGGTANDCRHTPVDNGIIGPAPGG
jgi:hypothetical protein